MGLDNIGNKIGKEMLCSRCSTSCVRKSGAQKYCSECRGVVEIENNRARNLRYYYKKNPDAIPLCVRAERSCYIDKCDGVFSSSFEGKDYCNKHWQSMYRYGTSGGKPYKGNEYVIKGDYVEFKTTGGLTYLVDLEDFDLVKQYKWIDNASGYLVRNLNQKSTQRLQRMVMNVTDPKLVVDHINGDRHDNRKCNLRVTTNKNNTRNNRLAKNNNSGYTGVRELLNGRYQARIMVDRKEINLGFYETFEEAKEARIKGEQRYFGEFAPSNGALRELASL